MFAASAGSEWARSSGNAKKFAEARIDLRKLAQFFSAHKDGFTPTRVVCSECQERLALFKVHAYFRVADVVEDRLIHFSLLHEDISLQFFTPVIHA